MIWSAIPDHVIFAPMSLASDGPTLLTQLRAMMMELTLSMPDMIMIVVVTKRFYMTHGHTMGVRHGVPRKFMALTRNLGADIVVFGHSHSYYEETVDGVLYLNPGAMMGSAFTYTFTYMVLTIDGETVTVEKREMPLR